MPTTKRKKQQHNVMSVSKRPQSLWQYSHLTSILSRNEHKGTFNRGHFRLKWVSMSTNACDRQTGKMLHESKGLLYVGTCVWRGSGDCGGILIGYLWIVYLVRRTCLTYKKKTECLRRTRVVPHDKLQSTEPCGPSASPPCITSTLHQHRGPTHSGTQRHHL